MSEKSFFTRSFIGRDIVFGGSRPSTWTLTEKLSEEIFQKDRISYQNSGILSVAHGTFHCRNPHSETAMIKIIMQIPYAASELEDPQYRAQQASNEVPFLEQWEIDARKKLAINGCTSTHTLHNLKVETQGINGSVPGGFIVYMRLEAVPGVRLGYVEMDDGSEFSEYWKSSSSVREDIRQAFKTAWQDCVKAGVTPCSWDLGCLIWDARSKRIYIDGFESSDPASPGDTWDDDLWFAWGLLEESGEM